MIRFLRYACSYVNTACTSLLNFLPDVFLGLVLFVMSIQRSFLLRVLVVLRVFSVFLSMLHVLAYFYKVSIFVDYMWGDVLLDKVFR